MSVFRPVGPILSAQGEVGEALGMVLECSSALKGPFKLQRLCVLILSQVKGRTIFVKTVAYHAYSWTEICNEMARHSVYGRLHLERPLQGRIVGMSIPKGSPWAGGIGPTGRKTRTQEPHSVTETGTGISRKYEEKTNFASLGALRMPFGCWQTY